VLSLLPPASGPAGDDGQVLLSGTPEDVSSAVEALASRGWLLSAALRVHEQEWQVQLRPRGAAPHT